jgi:nicotinamidase-related amidase
MLIDQNQSALLVVDIQQKLAPIVHGHEQVISNAEILLKTAVRLNVPVLISEQYPKGLGHTVSELTDLAPKGSVVEKTSFSCALEKPFATRLAALQRKQVVIAGMESHICVLQTALGLQDEGYVPFVVADATSSRRPESYAIALDRLRSAGVTVVTTEMVMFEWLGRAGTPEFKELSALIK